MDTYYSKEQGLTITPPEHMDFRAPLAVLEEIPNQLDNDLRITVDFCSTTHIDSSGIGALLKLQHYLPKTAPRIHFINLNEDVYRIFSTFNMETVFDIEH